MAWPFSPLAATPMTSTATPVPTRRRGRRTKLQRGQTRLAWLLLVPSLAVVAIVAIYPLGKTISAGASPGRKCCQTDQTHWVGISNYCCGRLWLPARLRLRFRNLEHDRVHDHHGGVRVRARHGHRARRQSKFKGRGLMRTAMLVPWAIPTAVSSQMWKWMYNDVFGVVNDFWCIAWDSAAEDCLGSKDRDGTVGVGGGGHLEDDALYGIDVAGRIAVDPA